MNAANQLAALQGQVGFHEGPNNAQPFGIWQGVANSPWCDSFAQWGAVLNGGYSWPSNSQFGTKGDAYCPYTVQHAQNLGIWRDKSSTPEPGWQILFSWNHTSVADHIGTVVKMLANGNILTCEGNYQDSVQLVERDRTYVLGFVALPIDVPAPAPIKPEAPLGPDINTSAVLVSVFAFTHPTLGLCGAALTDDGAIYPSNPAAYMGGCNGKSYFAGMKAVHGEACEGGYRIKNQNGQWYGSNDTGVFTGFGS